MSVPSRPSQRGRAAAIAGVVLSAATCSVVVKAGIAYAPPILFGGLRSLLAGVVLLAVAAAKREHLLPDRRSAGTLLLLSLVATTAAYGGMFAAPARMGAGVASVLANLQPLFTIALAALFLGERMSARTGLALGAGLLGVVLLVAPGLRLSGADPIGPATAVAASLGAATGSVMVRRLRDRLPLFTLAGWQLLLGSVPLLAFGLLRGGAIAWTPAFWAVLIYLALVGTALSTALWFWLLRHDEAGRLSLYLFLIPLLGLMLGSAVYNEPVGPAEIAGGVVVAGAVAVAALDRRRRKAAQSSPINPVGAQ
jgi:drug/metabolite transporter (DMT)-like permease